MGVLDGTINILRWATPLKPVEKKALASFVKKVVKPSSVKQELTVGSFSNN